MKNQGAITWAIVAAAAWLLFTGIACAQTTQPATAPAPKVIHATTQPAADADGSEAKPLPIAKAVAAFRSGDTLLLHGGETFSGIQLGKLNGGTIGSYGDKWATIDAQYPLLIAQVSGNWDVGHFHFIDHTRNPDDPAFTPHPGGMGMAFRDSPNGHLWLHDFTVDWTAIGVDVEAVGEHGTVIERGIFRNIYGINQRSQGIFSTLPQERYLAQATSSPTAGRSMPPKWCKSKSTSTAVRRTGG